MQRLAQIVIVVLIFILLKRKMGDSEKTVSGITANAPAGLKRVSQKYGLQYARKIEQLLRLEGSHFKSSQWIKCGTAGMVATSNEFPYGWGYLKKFAQKHGIDESKFNIVYFGNTSDGKPRNYIKFPDTGLFVDFVAEFLKVVRGGNINAWYSLDKGEQYEYALKLDKIKTHFV